MRIIGVIPAHLASVRFPRKILHPFYGLPMIEHVRRRALMSKLLDKVYVATCDDEIAALVRKYDGDVIMTGDHHKNGTSRVSEAVKDIECTHVILLQGDEPLLLPSHVDAVAQAIMLSRNNVAWNATGPIDHPDELDKHSFVKCVLKHNQSVALCFRRSPLFSSIDIQKKIIRKILGIIAYEKKFLLSLSELQEGVIEQYESIEQMRIIESGIDLISVDVAPSLPSVNEINEANFIEHFVSNDIEQKLLLDRVLGWPCKK